MVRASERENSDLFWGLCGGGGNFGVATSFEYKLHPVGPEIIAGAIAWRGEEAAGVLEMYRSLATQAPRELTCVAALRLAPPAPWLAKDVHGKPIVALFVCYSGPLADAERLIAPIKAFGTPVGDIVQKRSYVSQQTLLDATQPKGRRYYWKSEYLRSLEPELFPRAIEHASRIVSPHSAILIFPIDGALNQLPEDHSAVGNRDAAAVLNIASAWEHAEDDADNIEWARSRLARHASVFHRRHLRQLPHRRGRRRAHPRRVPDELCPPGPGQGQVGSLESLPNEQEHRWSIYSSLTAFCVRQAR